MKVTRKAIMEVVDAVVSGGFKKATRILDAKTKVTLTAKAKSKGTYTLTMGALNYAEREFVKARKAADQSFTKMITKG